MKPAPFDYFAPTTFDEAVDLMAAHGDAARPLAGGQSLVALMNTRILQPAVIVDLGHCAGLDGIGADDGGITLAPMVRQASAEHSALVRQCCPLLAAALPHVGGTAHRNRGTVCGSLAHADPLAELPCVAVALDAVFTVAAPGGRRRVPAAEFFQGALTTAVNADELLESVWFPTAPPGTRAVFDEVGRNRRHGFALAGAAVQVETDPDGTCAAARITLMGVGEVPVRLTAVEAALQGRRLRAATIAEAVHDCGAAIEPRSDIHASADYRRAVSVALVKRGLLACCAVEGRGEAA